MDEARTTIAGRIPVDVETCFTDAKGRRRKGIEKRVRKWLEGSAPLLAPRLEEGETVRHAAPAVSPFSILEFLTTGWIIFFIKRCLLVVTDRRILHLPTDLSYRPKGSISQVRFGDLNGTRVKGLLGKSLRLVYRGGGKETFGSVPGGHAASLRRALEGRDPSVHPPSALGVRHYLCPGCGEGLRSLSDEARCRVCGLRFRSRKRALWLSVLVPGGGYFYTGHPILGLLDAIVEGGLLLLIGTGIALAATDPALSYADVGPFVILLAIEKLITIYHAGHYVAELQPADRSFRPLEQSAAPAVGRVPS